MGAGVVYAVIIAMWAIVLVPMWLQRHDQANEVRSADRFQVAMRRLRSSKFVEAKATAEVAQVPMRRTPAQRAAARRRRNVLLVLTLLTLLSVAAGLVGVAPVWTPGLPIVLLLAFLVAAFNAAQRSVDLSAATPLQRRLSAHVSAPPTLAAAFAENVSLPIAVGLRPGQWVATSTPLPSYVTAPPATRVPRLLDLRTPGKWTSAAMLDQVAAAKAAKVKINSFAELFVDDAPTVDVGAEDLDSVIERRAVNG